MHVCSACTIHLSSFGKIRLTWTYLNIYKYLHISSHSDHIYADHGDDHRVRGHGAADLDRQDRGLLLLRVRHLLLRAPGRE